MQQPGVRETGRREDSTTVSWEPRWPACGQISARGARRPASRAARERRRGRGGRERNDRGSEGRSRSRHVVEARSFLQLGVAGRAIPIPRVQSRVRRPRQEQDDEQEDEPGPALAYDAVHGRILGRVVLRCQADDPGVGISETSGRPLGRCRSGSSFGGSLGRGSVARRIRRVGDRTRPRPACYPRFRRLPLKECGPKVVGGLGNNFPRRTDHA